MEDRRSMCRQRRRYKVTVNANSWFTTDVCAGGFCAEMMRVLPLRSLVEGSIHVRVVQVPFAGKVTWATRGDWHVNLRGRMGLQFTRIAADLARLFDRSLEGLVAGTSRDGLEPKGRG